MTRSLQGSENGDGDDDVSDPSAPLFPPPDDADLNTTFVDDLQSRQREEEEEV